MSFGALADPTNFVDGVPHELLAELRVSDPVSWQDIDGQNGFFAVLRHADVVTVAREPNLYSASEGGVIVEDMMPDHLARMRNMLLAMDPPWHVAYRKPLADRFRARVIANMEGQIREICRNLMLHAREQGPIVEFVHDVTAGLPTRVMGRLMGLPEQDWGYLHDLSERGTSAQDPDIVGDDYVPAANVEMAVYAMNFAARRESEPLEDLTSLILASTFDGDYMTDVDFGSFFVQLVTAGNDTTKTMLSGGLYALLQHPDQLAELHADRSLIPGAVEEILRWANPLHYFRRTTTADTQLSGVDIPSGTKVAMYYTSANRDEKVFDDSQRFDIHRSPNPHLSFGIAEHFCLGVHLARLEGRVFFEELLDAFDTIELAGEPVRLRSNLNNSYKKLPVRLA